MGNLLLQTPQAQNKCLLSRIVQYVYVRHCENIQFLHFWYKYGIGRTIKTQPEYSDTFIINMLLFQYC